MSIFKSIVAPVIVAVGIVGAAAAGCYGWLETVKTERIQHARVAVESADSLVRAIALTAASGERTVVQAQELAREAISRMHFDGSDGYLFAYSGIADGNPGVVIAHGKNSALVGKGLWDKRDASGRLMIQGIVKVAAANVTGGWTIFDWSNGPTEPAREKTAFSKSSSWGWVIGSGVYTDTLSDEYSVAVNIMLLVVVLVISGAVLVIVSRPAAKKEEDFEV